MWVAKFRDIAVQKSEKLQNNLFPPSPAIKYGRVQLQLSVSGSFKGQKLIVAQMFYCGRRDFCSTAIKL